MQYRMNQPMWSLESTIQSEKTDYKEIEEKRYAADVIAIIG